MKRNEIKWWLTVLALCCLPAWTGCEPAEKPTADEQSYLSASESSLSTTEITSCQLPNKTCIDVTPLECSAKGGKSYAGRYCTSACCTPTGKCFNVTAAVCKSRNGVFHANKKCGADGSCPTDPKPEACCLPNGKCADLVKDKCKVAGGTTTPGQLCSSGVECPPCEGECINGSYCDNPNCCVVPGNCICYAPEHPISIEKCGCKIAIKCASGLVPTDTDGDGCDDTCLCPDGAKPQPDGSCECKGECINGSYCDNPDCCIDPNNCVCYVPTHPISIKMCGCGVSVDCPPGLVPTDTDKDGCPDKCLCPDGTKPNANGTCECIGECINGSYCDNPDCCIVPDNCVCYVPTHPISIKYCGCPFAILCAPGFVPIDKDNDGCDDACVCADGSLPDPTGNCGGCFGECINGSYCDNPKCCVDPDNCVCYAPEHPISIKLCGCTTAIKCAPGLVATDTNGDGCPDICLCPDGNKPFPDGSCECKGECINGSYCDNPNCCIDPNNCLCYAPNHPISIKMCGCGIVIDCKPGLSPADTNGDGCPDTCLCPDGTKPTTTGECKCIGECINGSYCDNPDCCIDPNNCLCYAPNHPVSIKMCGCAIAIDCLPGLVPYDIDGDGCADKCLCPDGNKPDSTGSCECKGECINGGYCDNPNCCIDPNNCLCYVPTHPVSIKMCGCPLELKCPTGLLPTDTNGDGCKDACLCPGGKKPNAAGGCDCIGECINGSYCDNPDCCIEPNNCVCYIPTHPISLQMCGCSKQIQCPIGLLPTDTNGDGCKDQCLCPSGAPPNADGSCKCVGECINGSYCDNPNCCIEPGNCLCYIPTHPISLQMCGCPKEPKCPLGLLPTDTNGDGCKDACLCPGGKKPNPAGGCDCVGECINGAYCDNPDCCIDPNNCVCYVPTHPISLQMCGCPKDLACPFGLLPMDTNGDGCKDKCMCPGGLAPNADGSCECFGECINGSYCDNLDCCVVPDNCVCYIPTHPISLQLCGCPKELNCPNGLIPTDTNGDGCKDKCMCPGGQAPNSDGSCTCFGECINGSYCDNPDCCVVPGNCVCYIPTHPISLQLCGCTQDLKCPTGLLPTDTNGDGCKDKCLCPGGLEPAPTGLCECIGECINGSYCDNMDCCIVPGNCVCYIPTHPISLQMCSCPNAIKCASGFVATDTNGDGCADACLCPDGNPPDPTGKCDCGGECIGNSYCDSDACCPDCQCYAPTHPISIEKCGCKTNIVCPTGQTPKDTTGDGCPDVCVCPDGTLPPPTTGTCPISGGTIK